MTWISTRSGKKIDFFQPDPSQIDVDDIAHGLAAVPRWLGQTTIPYSVAQHSWLCSKMCPRYPLAALLHDAAEAYMGDCPRPLKEILGGSWGPVEGRLQAAIFQRFGLPPGIPPAVKAIDDRLLITERRDQQPRATPTPCFECGCPLAWEDLARACHCCECRPIPGRRMVRGLWRLAVAPLPSSPDGTWPLPSVACWARYRPTYWDPLGHLVSAECDAAAKESDGF